MAIGRKFNRERSSIHEHLPLCLTSGERLEKSTQEFAQLYPDMGIYFVTQEYNEYSPQAVVEKLDAGEKVVILNIQNMKFSGQRFVKGRYGHNVCCIGHKNGRLIFADSNRPCRKTMDISLLQAGYDAIKATEGASDLLDAPSRVHIQLISLKCFGHQTSSTKYSMYVEVKDDVHDMLIFIFTYINIRYVYLSILSDSDILDLCIFTKKSDAFELEYDRETDDSVLFYGGYSSDDSIINKIVEGDNFTDNSS